MKPLDYIKEYSPRALFSRAKERLPKAETLSRYAPHTLFSRIKEFFAAKEKAPRPVKQRIMPPVPPGKRWYLVLLDVVLLSAMLMSAVWVTLLVTTPDPRITVQLDADGSVSTHCVFPTNVKTFLADQHVTLGEGDILSCDITAPLKDGMEIRVTRAFPVAVKSQDGVSVLHLAGGTVGDALRAAAVQHDVSDELSHLSFESLTPGMQIIHTDVVTEYDTAYKTLEYKEEIVKDDKVYNDTDPVVLQEGEDGTKQVTYRLTYKNGIRVSREVVDQVVITPSTPEIIKVGTKIHYQTHLSGEFRIYKKPPTAGKDGWVEMTMDYITAYTGDTQSATGVRPKLGCIAVNPYYIPYGTEIYVKGYGYGKAQDTGAFRNYKREDGSPVNQLDLFMNTEKECRRWGRKRNVTVLVRMG
ncbi:MAG: G5 domain-containing protein [Clostridia bacterium]|nr:G5 domain-containing protein [Clostridia bacterium]